MTERIIQKVQSPGFRGFIAWADGDDKHVNPVFIASFQHPVAGLVEAYVKLYPYQKEMNKGLINEVTGYLYGHALQVPQPAHAFLAEIPLKKLREIEQHLPPGHWLREVMDMYSVDKWPGFCSTRLDGKSAAVHVPDSEISALREDIAAWSDLPRAVAMDENIAHVDRHFNNLIRLSRKEYAVIDNGRLVNGMDEQWTCDMLDPSALYRNRLSEHVWGHKPNDTIITEILDFAQRHQAAFATIENELEYWLGLLLPKERADFSNFLSSRTESVEWLLRKRYQRLI